jgi:hypothetical protein
MKYLLNNLIIILFAASCTAIGGVKRAADALPGDLVWSKGLTADTAKITLRADIQVKNSNFSGLCILKRMKDELRGTVISEFGAKAFDFAVNGEGCRLLNVNRMLDKKYIKKTLEEDLYFLFEADSDQAPFHRKAKRLELNGTLTVSYKKKQIKKEPDGTVMLANLKYDIKYKFRKITEIDRNKTIL